MWNATDCGHYLAADGVWRAMITACIECGGKVSDHAVACPHCGYPTVEPCGSSRSTEQQLRAEGAGQPPPLPPVVDEQSPVRREPQPKTAEARLPPPLPPAVADRGTPQRRGAFRRALRSASFVTIWAAVIGMSLGTSSFARVMAKYHGEPLRQIGGTVLGALLFSLVLALPTFVVALGVATVWNVCRDIIRTSKARPQAKTSG